MKVSKRGLHGTADSCDMIYPGLALCIWQRRGASLLSSSSSSASVWSLGPSLGEFTLPGLRALGASAACLIWFKKGEEGEGEGEKRDSKKESGRGRARVEEGEREGEEEY